MQAGVDKGNAPVVQVPPVQLDGSSAVAEREGVRHGLVILQEILADQVAAKSKTEDKVLVAEMSVIAHQVPNDRSAADVDQGLGQCLGMFAQSRTEAATKKHHLHFDLRGQFRMLNFAPAGLTPEEFLIDLIGSRQVLQLLQARERACLVHFLSEIDALKQGVQFLNPLADAPSALEAGQLGRNLVE